jgi:RNA polymerase-binding protein DksA
MMEKESELQTVREQLRTEYQRLSRRIISVSRAQQGKSLNPDRADLAQNYTLQEQDAALNVIEKNRLEQISRALERLESGTYGQCLHCGQAIALERLQVAPSAELCIHCQEKQERT